MNIEKLHKLIDYSSEGIIVVDRDGIIKLYNKSARKIFGIEYETSYGHQSGKIEDGDIVILADNFLGGDDGDLTPKDLEAIGIKDREIKKGTCIVAIGTYNEKENIYKIHNGLDDVKLSISTEIDNLEVRAVIDCRDKYVEINVNNINFYMKYIYSIGFMVIIDSKTKNIKFYQDKGYTARKEGIRDILIGKEYIEKLKKNRSFEVLNKHILDIHEDSEAINKLMKVANLEEKNIHDAIWNINGRRVLSKVLCMDKQNGGAALIIEDTCKNKSIEKSTIYEGLVRSSSRKEKIDFESIIGNSYKSNKVKELAWKASKSNSTVLILGESGTGKTLLGNEIHKKSNRCSNPFIHVNCAAIPDSLLESELFGYEKGAFTGANNRGKIGYFELAQGGTLFLDEVFEMSSHMQVKVLNVIQNKFLYRIGGSEKINLDIRIIAATNKDLKEEVKKGNFREDLYYRINVFPIDIPALRERPEDISNLIEGLLPEICKKIGITRKRISLEAMNKLYKYKWPGNIRELENIIERAANLSDGDIILSKDIEIPIEDFLCEERISYKEQMIQFEKQLLSVTINRFNGDKKKAMEYLKMPKTTFYDRMKKCGID